TGRLGAPAQRRTGPVVASTGRTMPEGAYALGAIQREPGEQASWWPMPPPTWAPFLGGPERARGSAGRPPPLPPRVFHRTLRAVCARPRLTPAPLEAARGRP